MNVLSLNLMLEIFNKKKNCKTSSVVVKMRQK